MAFTDAEFRHRLAKALVRGDHPFSLVDQPEFRLVFNLLRPGVAVPAAYTVRCDVVKHYRDQVDRVGERLRKVGSKISVTLDCWTSSNNKAFLGITGHYIDDDWVLQSLVLDFVPLCGEHTGENLCGAFVGACERLGILDKLLAVTTDNASNISKLLDCFKDACFERRIVFNKEQQHMRCVAHVMNLAVQAFLLKAS